MLVIGIAGPSCSGKSTIASAVAQKLVAPVVCLDYQYDKNAPHMFTDGIRTFERPDLYRGNELARIAKELVQDGHSTFKELKNKVIIMGKGKLSRVVGKFSRAQDKISKE